MSATSVQGENVQCENCGGAVSPDAPSGLCPNCLLRVAIEHGASRALAPFLPKLHYFEDYELLEEIARGGMGVVYRARQVSLERTVAVKMMRPGLLASEAEIARFHTEAKTAAGLQHPNIVAIHEVGAFDGLHYFSMDFVEGPSLADVVREKPLSSPECARYVQILAETIEYAHARGVLHRDLKPSNVLVDAAGQPRITDFGLALHLDKDNPAPVGSVVGTPAYMPPEQASGVDDRSGPTADVYSLGAILYELLTGQAPFRAATQAETVRMVLEEKPVPPCRLNPDASAGLEAICLRCLEKNPAKRYQSASELAKALQSLHFDSPSAPPLDNWVRNNRRLALFAVGVLVFFAAAMITVLITKPTHRIVTHGRPPALPFVPPHLPNARNKIALPPPVPSLLPGAAIVPRVSLPPVVLPAAVVSGTSISPESGSGFSQTFTLQYQNARQIELDFHDSAPGSNRHCDVLVDTDSGQAQLQFYPDRGPGMRTTGTLGSLARLENSVCTVDLSNGSFKAGEIVLPMIFKSGFEGTKDIEVWRFGANGNRQGKIAAGRWNVGP